MTATKAVEELVQHAIELERLADNDNSPFGHYKAQTILEMATCLVEGYYNHSVPNNIVVESMDADSFAGHSHILAESVNRAIHEGHQIRNTIGTLVSPH